MMKMIVLSLSATSSQEPASINLTLFLFYSVLLEVV
jgi:hypothetical protein